MKMENNSNKIAQFIASTLERYSDFGIPTPVMLSPENFSPVVGVMVETEEGTRLAYNIKVEFIGKEDEDNKYMMDFLDKIPEHVFTEVPKKEFLEYVENVFLKIENLDEIHIPAAVSFLKIKFLNGNIDVESGALMIKSQCKK